jgi:hypothetical protein
MFLHPQLLAFDAPNREECTALRMRSNTPKAALVLLNDPTFVEAARKLAERSLAATVRDDADRIAVLWRQAVSRSPDARERSLVQGLLDRSRPTGPIPRPPRNCSRPASPPAIPRSTPSSWPPGRPRRGPY